LNDSIRITLTRAKEARRHAEKLITLARKNSVAARRQAFKYLNDKDLVKKLFDEISPRFAGRAGGYTRIFRLTRRVGDGAEMALLELVVNRPPKEKPKERKGAEKIKEEPPKEESQKRKIAPRAEGAESKAAGVDAEEKPAKPQKPLKEKPKEKPKGLFGGLRNFFKKKQDSQE